VTSCAFYFKKIVYDDISVITENKLSYHWRREERGKSVKQYYNTRMEGDRMYSSYSFTTSALDDMSFQRHAPAALYLPGELHPVPIGQELGGSQGRSSSSPFTSLHKKERKKKERKTTVVIQRSCVAVHVQ
jgi:hypothetical protein